MALTTSRSPSIGEQLAHYSSRTSSSAQAIPKYAEDTFPLLRRCGIKEAKSSCSRVCTKVASVSAFVSPHTFLRLIPSLVAELNQITGIAAILTFPLDVEVVEAEEREAKEEEERKKQEAETATS